jgi:transcriptional regulator with XRE-family HTH domain
MTNIVPTIRWIKQQQSAGLTRGYSRATLCGTMIGKKKPPPMWPEFAARLEDAMRRASIDAKTIEEALGVNDETVRLWRRGERMPRKPKLDVLAKLLGESAAHLMHGEAGNTPSTMPGALTITDDDERLLLETYRQLPPWAKKSVRARANELLENFTPPGPANPYGKVKPPNTQ